MRVITGYMVRRNRGEEISMKPHLTAAAGGQKKSENQGDALGVNSEIGRKLKQYYDELVSEDVPDRFADLLRQLERSENQPSTAESGE